ncbi:hypothetical protein NEMBOFW57_007642 [Staphylotrichum longicolle]|uniref:histidine--tRNA ligase n=1 Tax=Staphylotrichum longicolle TaxID=669026 RepID=A0AAD4EV54_9PEZI|nr:hypothetical protein NEMBOFW57_007642 [Staphylotrichum longicolle]
MATKNSLKTPKGTRDWVGGDLLLRNQIFETITTILTNHGGTPLDTPVFELRSILSEKYGEEARLIYHLADQGGEACSLRYDLTVPFARWLAARSDVQHVRRFQIAKVYRRDQPAVARGRLREFYQCDFDIAGVYDPMIPDAEILCVAAEVFEAFEVDVVVKVNHRKILDGFFEVAGVPRDRIRAVSSAVDKLDKAPWDEVREELLEKGIPDEVADRVGGYVRRSGGMREMLESFASDAELRANERVMEGVADMTLLASYLVAMGVADRVSFDLSLARGLDYYTGLIYEVAVTDSADNPTQVGSIAAGGRYDDLVGMYGRRPLPCVGISFGVDRVFTILNARRQKENKPDLGAHAQVYIMAFGGKEFDGLLLERMRVARQLWNAGIRAEFAAKVKPKSLQQFDAAEGVPVAVMLGQDELEAGQVLVKRLHVGDKNATTKDKGQLVSREDLVKEVRKLLESATLEQE